MGSLYGAVSVGNGEGAGSLPGTAARLPQPASLAAGAKHDEERGGLLVVHNVKMASVGEEEDQSHTGIFSKGSRRTDNSRMVTILLVLNYMIGSGILNTSQTVLRSGLAATTVLYIIACESLSSSCMYDATTCCT